MLVNCNTCDKEFNKSKSEMRKSKTGKHYCGSSCAAKANNKGVNRHYNHINNLSPPKKCQHCDIDIPSVNGKYCSMKCQHAYQWNKKVLLIESGTLEGVSVGNMKRYLREHDAVCHECGVGEVYNKKPLVLEIDHIDGDATNHVLANCRLICPNCHSQTPTYKARNTNNPLGKEFRRDRYHKSIKAA